MPKQFIYLLILLPLNCFSQFTISGRILNYADKKPIANASVFLNNATAGTETDAIGYFKLNRIKSGSYVIIVSIVGYDDVSQQVQVNGTIKLETIFLQPSNKMLSTVVIKPHDISAADIQNFKEQFLGKSDIAKDCKILNPEVLDINVDKQSGLLTASSSDKYLIIENPDLGYRIKYKLLDFAYLSTPDSTTIQYYGNVNFEEMNGKASAHRRWQRKRLQVYKNSSMHFYRALLADRLDNEGFKAQQYAEFENPNRPPDSVIEKKISFFLNKILLSRDRNNKSLIDSLTWYKREKEISKIIAELRPFPFEQIDLLKTTNLPGIFAFGCEYDKIVVSYDEKHQFNKNLKADYVNSPENTNVTMITFIQPYGLIDRNGVLVDAHTLSYNGVWVNKRVGELLPIDYYPPQ